jgi:hypothetical protein
MSKLAAVFLAMAASAEPTEKAEPVTPPTDSSLKLCQGDCLEYTAHIRRQGYWECSLCQNRIYVADTTRSNVC